MGRGGLEESVLFILLALPLWFAELRRNIEAACRAVVVLSKPRRPTGVLFQAPSLHSRLNGPNVEADREWILGEKECQNRCIADVAKTWQPEGINPSLMSSEASLYLRTLRLASLLLHNLGRTVLVCSSSALYLCARSKNGQAFPNTFASQSTLRVTGVSR